MYLNYMNCEIIFISFEFDLMTLVLRLDLDIVKIYMCTGNEVLGFSRSKVIA